VEIRVLRFADRSSLDRAFARVVECMDVVSCVIEPEESRLRFVARNDVAEPLLELIYADGGLVFCTRHPVRQVVRDDTEAELV